LVGCEDPARPGDRTAGFGGVVVEAGNEDANASCGGFEGLQNFMNRNAVPIGNTDHAEMGAAGISSAFH